MKFKLKCPNCKTAYSCPCNSCNKETPNTKFRFEDDGENETCLTCGLSMHEEEWFDEEVKQICEHYGTNTLTEAVELSRLEKES